jgi:serine protease AprX
MRTGQVGCVIVLGGCVACSVESDMRASGGATRQQEWGLEAGLDGKVFRIELGKDGPQLADLDMDALSTVDWVPHYEKPNEPPTQVTANVPKINPALSGARGQIDVIVRLVDTHKIPQMPRLDVDETREDATWRAKEAVITAAIDRVRAQRKPSQDRVEGLIVAGGGHVSDRLWLINAISATINASELEKLASDESIASISAASGGNVSAEIVAGRNALSSDPYYDTTGMNFGYLALLDTGIRSTHTLLQGRTAWIRDCINGVTNSCGTAGAGLTLDPSDGFDHGTGVASVMSGNANAGSNSRGVTGIKLDSFRVAFSSGGINWAAVARGFQAAVAGGDNVVNVSLDCGDPNDSTCRDAANNAFDAGLIVIAAAGNSGDSPTNHIGEPGTAKKVLTVGALHPSGLYHLAYSATGPAPGGRVKPELMAVSGSTANTLVVALNSGDFNTGGKWGTSLSTPMVSGAAGLLSRWLKVAFGSSVPIEPGQTYAMLLASGINYTSPTTNNEIGAGQLVLPTNATVFGSKIGVSNGQTVDMSITVGGGTTWDAAIWWPEGTTHNDVDLSVIRPDGTNMGSSLSGAQVWEKVHVNSGTTGTWKIRTIGHAVTGTQTVYVAAIRR